ncbi:precorrin-6y C5,15-methyltransferase (decarboxylating) subunit CbiE [Nakamurella flava]|uniref:precorrin-6y C5,15-methyltransferase (decarboxylating) subunit CbiE n=1 Tax=Nakamurella flava TaxID=2576308 RepID=UPI001F110C0F|nr:precorrin-6y C5,15-methyltransferase (decarboxylating) subunit CbiE [Nakamurella flava]
MPSPPSITVVGIGADGWSGLGPAARSAIATAHRLFGGRRQLDLVPAADTCAERIVWPSPLRPALAALLAAGAGPVVVLASGDPLVSGIATTIVDVLGIDADVRVLPALSSVALARARMVWPAETTAVVSAVGRDPSALLRELSPGRRILLLSADATTPAAVAALLVDRGHGASRLTILGELGGPGESRLDVTAGELLGDRPQLPALHVLAVVVEPATGGAEPGPGVVPPPASWATGLPDDAFEHDGQLTKRDLRAAALARLAPRPGELLWDVGAGAGSIGIEWSRAHPTCRAVALERDPIRADRIARNARALGVPTLQVVIGAAPAVLDAALPGPPHAVFVGGAVSVPGVLDRCWAALPAGGRLVAHAVTLESERVLIERCSEYGGELIRVAVEHAAPLGGFTGWTPARAVVQYAAVKPHPAVSTTTTAQEISR